MYSSAAGLQQDSNEIRQIVGPVIDEGSSVIVAFQPAGNVLSKSLSARDTDFEFNGVKGLQAEGD